MMIPLATYSRGAARRSGHQSTRVVVRASGPPGTNACAPPDVARRGSWLRVERLRCAYPDIRYTNASPYMISWRRRLPPYPPARPSRERSHGGGRLSVGTRGRCHGPRRGRPCTPRLASPRIGLAVRRTPPWARHHATMGSPPCHPGRRRAHVRSLPGVTCFFRAPRGARGRRTPHHACTIAPSQLPSRIFIWLPRCDTAPSADSFRSRPCNTDVTATSIYRHLDTASAAAGPGRGDRTEGLARRAHVKAQ